MHTDKYTHTRMHTHIDMHSYAYIYLVSSINKHTLKKIVGRVFVNDPGDRGSILG